MRFSPRRIAALVLGIALASVTCTDLTGPASSGRVAIGFAPSFSRVDADIYHSLSAFSLAVDNVHLRLLHENGDLAKDTVVAFGPDGVTIEMDVFLNGTHELLTATIELREGTTVLFSGQQQIDAKAGVLPTGAAAPVPVTYVGPGSTAATLAVTPQDSTVKSTDSVAFHAVAKTSTGEDVTNAVLAWTVKDPAVGSVTSLGLFKPIATRGQTWIIARIPNGVKDSARITVVPLPTQLVVFSGDAQTGVAGSALAQPIVVEVRAADNLSVPNVPVTFAVVSGGGIIATTAATSDANGRASTVLTLGTTAGANSISATVASSAPLTIGATATAGTAVASMTTATVPAGVAGAATPIVVQAKDANGNNRTTTSGTVAASVTGANPDLPVTVTDNANGTYSLTYTPTVAGSDAIAITLGATPIGGSPYTSAVGPSALHHFAVEAASGGSIASQVAGVSFTVRITAQDARNNTVTSFTGTGNTVSMTSSGTLTAGGGTTAAFTDGVLAAHALTITTAGSQTITAVRTSGGTEFGSAAVPVVAAVASKLAFVQQPTNAIAGAAIAPFTVTVQDQFGNPRTDDSRSIFLSLGTHPAASLLSPTTPSVNAVNGIATFSGVSLTIASAHYTIVASATPLTSATSADFAVSPAALDHFAFATIGAQVRGTAFPITVSALDLYGNVVTGFHGTVDVSGGIETLIAGGNFISSAFTGGVLVQSLAISVGYSGSSIRVTRTGGTETTLSNSFDVATPLAYAAVAPSSYATASHTCGLTTDGLVYCWGSSDGGAMGVNPPLGGRCVPFETGGETCPVPLLVSGMPNLNSIVSGQGFSCGLATDGGSPFCWGQGPVAPSSTPNIVAESRPFSSMAAGGNHACGIDAVTSDAFCWGYNGYGNLGIGDLSTQTIPTIVYGEHKFLQLSAGPSNTCGITTTDNAIWCWGANSAGQLGNPDFTASYSPVPTSARIDAVTFASVGVGNEHACALTSDQGLAYCWGKNSTGQLGDGTLSQRTAPAPVSGGIKFSSISASSDHTCAVATDGAGYCWGANNVGQLGDGTNTDSKVPVKVSLPNGLSFASIRTGHEYACGVTTTNAVYCWGSNTNSQLGDGTKVDSRVPVLISPP